MRALIFGPLVAFGSVVVLVLGAVLGFVAGGAVWLPWLMLVGAIGFAGLGFRAQSAAKDEADQLLNRQSRIELLQAQLDQQQSAVDVLADGLDVAIFICDTKGSILYANRRAIEMFRFDAPIGRSVLAVTLSYDLEKLVLEAAQVRAPRNAELAFTFPEERVGMAKAWTHEQGGRVFLSIFEITDLRRLERVRQDFVANVSHEFRTPLTIIRAMAETLLDSPETIEDKGKDYMERIVSEVERLSLISNDLLILSTAESNIVRKHNCDIAVVFRAVVRDLQSRTADKGLTLSYRGPDVAIIEANETQMTQVALNLVENAINYTPSGSVSIALSVEPEWVEIDVEDTGIGIASEQLARIFERFYRVDKARSRGTGGTGLGLSIVKHIVEAHGGTVAVDSSLNKGSTFKIRLPIGNLVHE